MIFLNLERFIQGCRQRENCFIRNRKLSPKDIAFFILNRKNRDLETEVIDFCEQYKGGVSITKQAFSQARLNFRAEVFKDINDFHIKQIYDVEPELKDFKGRYVIAIDGTDVPIPTTKENIIKFGNASVKHAGEEVRACAMASAAACQLEGADNRRIAYAAEMGLEHHLGLTCDPVDGLVQIPCIERNALAAARALDCATYALISDGEHRISYDDVLATMMQTGLDMKTEYRETAKGGLARFFKRNLLRLKKRASLSRIRAVKKNKGENYE